jgi:transcriptional regulator GlxA family with amidase domain
MDPDFSPRQGTPPLARMTIFDIIGPMRPPRFSRPPARWTVAVVAFDGISPFHLSVPCLVFGEDRSEEGIPATRLLVCGERRGRLRTSTGFAIDAPHGLSRLAEADTIIVPSWRDVTERPPEDLLRALRRAHARGATIVGLCLGAFVLAETGLLDGRAATTHWRWAPDFRQRFPKVTLDADVLYIEDGRVVTSAGTAAGIDCCLHLLRAKLGAELANRVARRIVVSPHRQGGQAQYVESPLPVKTGGDRLSKILDWARGRLQEPLDLDTLAAKAAMSRRTFTRRFRQTTGTTVVGWLNAQRIALAQRLLETTDLPIEQVAASAGFGSPMSLRLHFARSLDTSPTAYRRGFQPDGKPVPGSGGR